MTPFRQIQPRMNAGDADARNTKDLPHIRENPRSSAAPPPDSCAIRVIRGFYLGSGHACAVKIGVQPWLLLLVRVIRVIRGFFHSIYAGL